MNDHRLDSPRTMLRVIRLATVSFALLVWALVSDRQLLAAPSVESADWPQFRGQGRDGLSLDTGLLRQWPEGGPAQLWTATGAGSGYSSMAVVGDRLYTMGSRDDKEYVHAFDLKTGNKAWERSTGKKFGNDRGSGTRGTPTVDGEFIYGLGANGDLACLRLDTGTPVWQRNVLEVYGGKNISWGLSESVLIDGNTLICMPGGPDATVVALNKKDGSLVWRSKGLSHSAGYASAVPFTVDGIRGLVHFTHEALVGLDAATGKTLWTFPKAANGIANAAAPLVLGDLVYATSDYGTGGGLVKLSKDGENGMKATEVYFNKDIQNHHGGVILVDGVIYGSSGNSGRNVRLVAMDFKTGEIHWKQDLGDQSKVSLVCADGHLYCLSVRGEMSLVEANKKKYVEKSRFVFKTYGEGEFKTGGIQEADQKPIWSYPVVAHKKLFLRDQDSIFCYDVAAK